jgi:hypothetical protein
VDVGAIHVATRARPLSGSRRIGLRTRLACWFRRRGDTIFPLIFSASEREQV